MKQLYLLFFALSIGFAQVPKVWWVDGTNGNDNNNGQSEATAFKSIQTVFTNNYLSAYNDTIYVKEGTYDFKDDNENEEKKESVKEEEIIPIISKV